ncbi:MAG: DUF3830 family protein [Candidatus Sumerlaeaceae bacterium]
MARKIRLSFPATGEAVVADLLDDEAPALCQMIWDRLPLEHKSIHGMYSGAEIFAVLDNPQPAPNENLVHLPLPGEILYFFDNSRNVTNVRPEVAELCIVYNRGVSLKGPEGAPTVAGLFARIPGDWKHDWIDFQKGCRRVRHEGPQTLRVERVEPG